jgi:Ran GTPase-activating protein (RanGAP) involved in mRNA processing and transport
MQADGSKFVSSTEVRDKETAAALAYKRSLPAADDKRSGPQRGTKEDNLGGWGSGIRPNAIPGLKFGGADLQSIVEDTSQMLSQEMDAYIEDNEIKLMNVSRYVPDHEFMNMSRKELGIPGVLNILENLKEDTFMKHINLSHNIASDEAALPHLMVALQKQIRSTLKVNKTLTALDLAYNHLFDYVQHPSNEHVHDYMIELTTSLVKSKVCHLDISGNFMCGSGGREYRGILYMMRKYCVKGGLKTLKVRDNRLHSQGCAAVSEGLGAFSNLQELDLRDNYLGLDPSGNFNSEGMMLMSRQLTTTKTLKILKLARNALRDEDITWLCGAIAFMPNMQELDISGNQLTGIGMTSLKEAIISHSALDEGQGLAVLDLSYNPLSKAEGINLLCEAIQYTLTIKSLNLRSCMINYDDNEILLKTLKSNGTILKLDVGCNEINGTTEALLMAEVAALNLVFSLRTNHLAVDADKLSAISYNAMAYKLRFLEPNVLSMCYGNPSFVKPFTKMKECLNMYEPPSRNNMLQIVFDKASDMHERRQESDQKNHIVKNMRIVFHFVMKWWEGIRAEKQLLKALEDQARKRKMESEKNEESAF